MWKNIIGVSLGIMLTVSALSLDVMSLAMLRSIVILTVVLAALFIVINKKESRYGPR